MAAGQICFYGEEVSSRVERIEENLTGILDQLDILETEAEGLSVWWEGAAYTKWKDTLVKQEADVAVSVRGMNVVIGAVVELAGSLWAAEKKNRELVEQHLD